MTLKELIDAKAEMYRQMEIPLETVTLLRVRIKDIEDQIEAIITEPAQAVRTATGKDTGTVDVLVQGYMVKHVIDKKVEWDQEKLAEVERKIREHNEDPAQYIKTKVTRSVDEKLFQKFPDAVKVVFSEARTLKPGKPKITIVERDNVHA